jgi:hypothetical protein
MKVWNYVVIFTGIALLLELGGIRSSGFSDLFRLIGITINSTGITNFDLEGGGFWGAVLGSSGILLSLGTGIVVGFFTRSSPERFIILPFMTGTLYFYGSIMVGLVSYGLNYSGWVASIGALLLVPLSIGFITALVEMFGTSD